MKIPTIVGGDPKIVKIKGNNFKVKLIDNSVSIIDKLLG